MPPASENSFYLSMAVAVVGFAFVNPSVSALVSRWGRPGAARRGDGGEPVVRLAWPHPGPFLGSVLFQSGASHNILPYLYGGRPAALLRAATARDHLRAPNMGPIRRK